MPMVICQLCVHHYLLLTTVSGCFRMQVNRENLVDSWAAIIRFVLPTEFWMSISKSVFFLSAASFTHGLLALQLAWFSPEFCPHSIFLWVTLHPSDWLIPCPVVTSWLLHLQGGPINNLGPLSNFYNAVHHHSRTYCLPIICPTHDSWLSLLHKFFMPLMVCLQWQNRYIQAWKTYAWQQLQDP